MVLFACNCLIHLEFIQITTFFLTPLCLCLKKYILAVENLESKIYSEENSYYSLTAQRIAVT